MASPEIRYVWGVAYDMLNDQTQVTIQAAKMSPEALDIINQCKKNNAPFTLKQREVIYNDKAVRLKPSDIERGNFLRNQPICDTHKHKVGHIVESLIQGTEVKVLAAITDPAAIKSVDSGEYTGFSIGYTFNNNQGEVDNIQVHEVSICKTPFFDNCRIQVAAAKDSETAAISVSHPGLAIVPNESLEAIKTADKNPSIAALGLANTNDKAAALLPLHRNGVEGRNSKEELQNQNSIQKEKENERYNQQILDILLQLAKNSQVSPEMASNAPGGTLPPGLQTGTPGPITTTNPQQQPLQQPSPSPPTGQPAGASAGQQQPPQQQQPPGQPAQQQQPPAPDDLRALAEKLQEQQRLVQMYEQEFQSQQKPKFENTLSVFSKLQVSFFSSILG